MRLGAVLVASTLLAISCGQALPRANGSDTASSAALTGPTALVASPTVAAPASPAPVVDAYGLLLFAGSLAMVKPTGEIGPTVPVSSATLQMCSSGLSALLEPPVSATLDKVFFRDGDTRIRFLTPTGQVGDATTVPGSASSVSFFSVSPDDQRIAVLVEDFSAASTIGLRLYVEDLTGGGHHADIYSTTTPKGPTGATLWPMGWHQGELVLASIATCSNDSPRNIRPLEWHLADPATGNRLVTIKGSCALSSWPSAAGVACIQSNYQASVFDWTGKVTFNLQPPTPYQDLLWQSGLSPSGQAIFFSSQDYCGDLCPGNYTYVQGSLTQGGVQVARETDHPPACLWIDETHLLSRNGVIALQSDQPFGNIETRFPRAELAPAGFQGDSDFGA